MEPNLVLSIGTVISVMGLFYTWHKDSKRNAETIATLPIKFQKLGESLVAANEKLAPFSAQMALASA